MAILAHESSIASLSIVAIYAVILGRHSVAVETSRQRLHVNVPMHG